MRRRGFHAPPAGKAAALSRLKPAASGGQDRFACPGVLAMESFGTTTTWLTDQFTFCVSTPVGSLRTRLVGSLTRALRLVPPAKSKPLTMNNADVAFGKEELFVNHCTVSEWVEGTRLETTNAPGSPLVSSTS